MSFLFIAPNDRPLGALAAVLPFGRRYFYQTGTLTEAPVYDEDGDVLEQPVEADITGLFPNVFLDPAIVYRVQQKTAADVLDKDWDPYPSFLSFEDFLLWLSYAPVPLYRLPGAADDNAAFAAALATGKPVYFPKEQGSDDDGAYLINTASGTTNVTTNAHIFGDGIGKTIIRRPTSVTGTFQFFIDSGSDDPDDNLTNIYFHDLTIEDDGAFSAFQHQMWLGGVTDFLIERVEFKGFRGDGLYIGSGNNDPSTTERHNFRVTARDCVFNGVNNANRNGYSIIDCDGFLADNCTFINCTKLDGTMPGPQCVEPDANDFHVVRNIRSTNCKFYGCGGFAFALNLGPQTFPTTPYEQFTFDNFYVEDGYGLVNFNGFATTGAVTGVTPYNVTIRDGEVKGLSEVIARFDGAFGARFQNVQITDAPAIQFGFSTGARCRELSFTNNSFARCGLGGQVFQQADDVVSVTISDNLFIDCGKADGTQGFIYLVSVGTADVTGLHLDHNTVTNPNTKTTAFARVVGGYAGTIDSTSTKIGNVLPSLATADNLTLSGVGGDWLQFSATFDPGSLALGASGAIQTVAATGVALGDYVDAVSFSLDAAGVTFPAYVSATDVISYFAHNLGGANPVDLSSGTIRFRVRKRVL
jgi:hypothetical protein